MGDYYASWKRRYPGIYQRTVSYRSRAPRGAVSRSRERISQEEKLEQNSNLSSTIQLYSDLYAEADIGETYNSEDTGHEFLTQVWKCRPASSFPLVWGEPAIHNRHNPSDWVGLQPMNAADAASMGTKHALPVAQQDDTGVGYFSRCSYPNTDRAIQNALWAQCPDRITGSLGQDVVDVVGLGKGLKKLLSLQKAGVSLYKQYLRFSAKQRRKIDEAFALWRRHPGKGLKSLSRRISGDYLTWLFQYLPWYEDLQTLLGAAASSYLRAIGRTRERKIVDLTKAVNSDQLGGSLECLLFDCSLDSKPPVIPNKDFERCMKYCDSWFERPCERDAIWRVTGSVVSVWQKTFEHGAAEPLYELNKKLGLVYPSLIWDLIPWSWLVDWFIKVGDFIDRAWMNGYGEWNCSYAYVTTKYSLTYMGMAYFQTCRWHISPRSGLGVETSSQLSNSQWDILAALGLSHRN